MPKICMKCYEIYREDLPTIKGEYNFCPKATCYGEVVEIDELMFPTIIELNKKGYFTEYCCSGHYYEKSPNSYIKFQEDVELPSLPKGYKLEPNLNNSGVTIRRHYDDGDFDSIVKSATELFKWAKSLKESEE